MSETTINPKVQVQVRHLDPSKSYADNLFGALHAAGPRIGWTTGDSGRSTKIVDGAGNVVSEITPAFTIADDKGRYIGTVDVIRPSAALEEGRVDHCLSRGGG